MSGRARILLWGSLFLSDPLCVPTLAQVSLSVTLDATYRQDILREENGEKFDINTVFNGGSPFGLIRARFFVDGTISENITVSTIVLFDDDAGHPQLDGAYINFTNIRQREAFNLRVGKLATPFGAFAARTFSNVNPLIGTPLIYHYFSAVQGASVSENNADQLRRREVVGHRGLPILYDACWNAGVEIYGFFTKFDYALALTKGALSSPSARDNDGGQLVGRIGMQPAIGFKFGLSAAYGPYLKAATAFNANFPTGKSVESHKQWVYGFDLEYSYAYFELYAELVHNQWEVPNIKESTLGNTGGYVEGRYTIAPGFYFALRYGQIVFDKIDNGAGRMVAWDYGIKRLETGFGYYIDRNVRLKVLTQLNFRDGPDRHRKDHMLAVGLSTFL